jgi:hypothetical protein
VELVHREMEQDLPGAGRPADHDAIHPFGASEPKMGPAVVLAGEPHPAVDDAAL